MKNLLFISLLIIFPVSVFSQLNTKLIASKYGKSIVKIIMFDAQLEKDKPGSGYLSRGSGFFVSSDGYIITNRHVVQTAVTGYIDYDYKDSKGAVIAGFQPYSENIISAKNFVKAYRTGYTVPIIQVFHGNNEDDYKLYSAKVVAIGMGAFDGALLKIVSDEKGNKTNFNFTPVPIGNSDAVQQGEQLCVFGFPAQIRGVSAAIMLKDMSTLSLGIMSGYEMVMNSDYGYIKTDADINPGNSGGPVFNEENKVIGIATATGRATGIGLVGGINGMFYVTASNASAHDTLVKKGLKPPKRSHTINTITGNKLPIKTVAQINAAYLSSGGTGSTSTDYYAKSKIYFSNVSIKNNNNKFPSTSQRYTSFRIDKKKGGVIYVYVDNYPNKMNTTQIVVLIDKLAKNGKYEKFKDLVYDITSTIDFTYFPFNVKEEGSYKFRILSKEKLYINTGTVKISYK